VEVKGMAETHQTLMLDAIAERISKAGRTPIVKSEWANTGMIQAAKPGAFGSERAVSFQFSDRYVSFESKGSGPAVRLSASYTNPESLESAARSVVEHLLGADR